jgi:hypothetical protein
MSLYSFQLITQVLKLIIIQTFSDLKIYETQTNNF